MLLQNIKQDNKIQHNPVSYTNFITVGAHWSFLCGSTVNGTRACGTGTHEATSLNPCSSTSDPDPYLCTCEVAEDDPRAWVPEPMWKAEGAPGISPWIHLGNKPADPDSL